MAEAVVTEVVSGAGAKVTPHQYVVQALRESAAQQEKPYATPKLSSPEEPSYKRIRRHPAVNVGGQRAGSAATFASLGYRASVAAALESAVGAKSPTPVQVALSKACLAPLQRLSRLEHSPASSVEGLGLDNFIRAGTGIGTRTAVAAVAVEAALTIREAEFKKIKAQKDYDAQREREARALRQRFIISARDDGSPSSYVLIMVDSPPEAERLVASIRSIAEKLDKETEPITVEAMNPNIDTVKELRTFLGDEMLKRERRIPDILICTPHRLRMHLSYEANFRILRKVRLVRLFDTYFVSGFFLNFTGRGLMFLPSHPPAPPSLCNF
jgi:hypothetical protein